MDKSPRSVTWEAPEYRYQEKGGDWFFVLIILVISLMIAAILLDNALFALLVGVSGGALAVAGAKRPSLRSYEVSLRGIRIDGITHPYGSLKTYCIDETEEDYPQLLVLTQKRFTPLIVIPLPKDYIDDVEEVMLGKLEESFLQEPLFMKILEKFGF